MCRSTVAPSRLQVTSSSRWQPAPHRRIHNRRCDRRQPIHPTGLPLHPVGYLCIDVAVGSMTARPQPGTTAPCSAGAPSYHHVAPADANNRQTAACTALTPAVTNARNHIATKIMPRCMAASKRLMGISADMSLFCLQPGSERQRRCGNPPTYHLDVSL